MVVVMSMCESFGVSFYVRPACKHAFIHDLSNAYVSVFQSVCIVAMRTFAPQPRHNKQDVSYQPQFGPNCKIIVIPRRCFTIGRKCRKRLRLVLEQLRVGMHGIIDHANTLRHGRI